MKIVLLSLLIFPLVSSGQIIFATVKEGCMVWSDPTHNGKRISNADRGDSCILIEFIPAISGSDWFKVAVVDTIGYIMSGFLKIDSNDLHTLSTTNHHTARESAARLFMRNNWKDLRSVKQKLAKKREDSLKAAAKIWDDQIKAMRKELSKIGLILNSQEVSNNILGYPDFKVSIMNCSDKTIKYIWYNITLFNSVDDAVKSCTLKGVGPVYAFRTADFSFETVAISKIVDYSKINSIKIQYMDGAVMIFSSTQILSNTRRGNEIIDRYAATLIY